MNRVRWVVLLSVFVGCASHATTAPVPGDDTRHRRVSYGEPLRLESESLTIEILADRRTVQARDDAGVVVWKSDVIAICGPPPLGEPVVEWMALKHRGVLGVGFGKHSFASIELRTGV